MALSPVISAISYNAAGTIGTVSDSTTYGSPELNRVEVAVFLEAWKVDSLGAVTSLTISNSSPTTVTSWQFDSSIDGHYRFRQYIIPIYNISTVYNINDVVYSTSTSKLYISLIGSNVGNAVTNESSWEEVENYSNTVVSGNNVVASYTDRVVIEQGKKCAGKAIGDWAKSNDCGACSKIDLGAKWAQRHSMVIAIQRYESISQFSRAEEMARKLQNLCTSC